MSRDYIARHLTLRKINYSPNEMEYITRMRNAIKFQIASQEDCNCFKKPFKHLIVCKWNEITELRICLDHALSKVVKSYVLLHNSEPFLQWRTITIDNDGFFQIRSEDQRIAEISKKTAENKSVDRFLVPNFRLEYGIVLEDRWPILRSGERPFLEDAFLHNFRLICIANHHYLPLEFTWRRVYSNDGPLVLFDKVYVAAYLDDQIRNNRSVNVFKQIVNREINEKFFNQFEILRAIASPYYFVLPYKDLPLYAPIGISAWYRHLIHHNYGFFYFQSRLDVAMKIVP
ncbi:uncharacterized protein NPIL_599011 [Nephila pilipes]|uniref:Uncharacterized protein n=1 Tax=Nephila pilipes TaxID=299642 RepID=A0A8X6NIC6_NEPPI|nr:uncharacterized protein NPIL_599011 [Nephila pilipes]